MSKKDLENKDNKKQIKKKIRKIFKKENVVKIILLFVTVALILSSILPYFLTLLLD
jgi:uncharacterized membrane protein YwzB